MSESLIIEGKQYISSRRAAEIAGYSNDYVGQLCRAKKLTCRMVGRFWYVDQQSILRHQKESLKPNQTIFKKADFLASTPVVKSPIISPKKAISQNVVPQAVAEKPITQQTGISQVIAPQVAAIQPPPEWKWTFVDGSEAKVSSPSGLTDYIHFGLPISVGTGLAALLIVVMAGNIRFQSLPQFLSAGASAANVFIAAQSVEQSAQSIGRSAQREIVSAWDSLSSGVVSFSSGVVSLASRLHPGSSSVNSSLTMNQSEEPSASSVIPPGEVGKVTAEHGGLVIMPTADTSGASSSADEAKLAASIQNSFSDNVVVTPNPDGTTGVITPVFRTVAGHDFLYVLVPVKATSSPAAN